MKYDRNLLYGIQIAAFCPVCMAELPLDIKERTNWTEALGLAFLEAAKAHKGRICDPQWNWTPEQQGYFPGAL